MSHRSSQLAGEAASKPGIALADAFAGKPAPTTMGVNAPPTPGRPWRQRVAWPATPAESGP
ncbi:hypothetical protein C3L29_015055 [Pseudomonas sp. MWU12-2534b]|nr:hypothetical protein C3L29_015055 [Pseudomonas sp. MWU12-2534b]